MRLLISCEILYVLLISAFQNACGNSFTVFESIDNKKNITMFGFHMLLKKTLCFLFTWREQNKLNKKFLGTDRRTCLQNIREKW